jgi:hypothetical protein
VDAQLRAAAAPLVAIEPAEEQRPALAVVGV